MSSIDYGIYQTMAEDLANLAKNRKNDHKRIENSKKDLVSQWRKLDDYEKYRGVKLEKALKILHI